MPDCSHHENREACAQVMFKDGSHEDLCRGCLTMHRGGPEGLDTNWQDNVIMFYPAWDDDLKAIQRVAEASGPAPRDDCPRCGFAVTGVTHTIAGRTTYTCVNGHSWGDQDSCPWCRGQPVRQATEHITGNLWGMKNFCARGHSWVNRLQDD